MNLSRILPDEKDRETLLTILTLIVALAGMTIEI